MTAEQQVSNFNLPNVLTTIRIVFIPVFLWALFKSQYEPNAWLWAAFALFVLLMATDKLDGYLARSRNLITNFGKIADPIADKALMISALVSLNILGAFGWWITILIVIRELGITIWRFFQLKAGKVVPASKGGKLKTVLQSVAVALFLVPVGGFIPQVALLVMLVALAVTVVTGIQYLLDARKLNQG